MTETKIVNVTIDGKSFEANPGELVINAAERAGVFIPRFCYHPRMTPVGMCRQCIVEVDTGRGPALQPSCMLECSDGMNVETGTQVTIKAQTGVLEFLLVNHPLDCPVCDKGGECPLQDQAMSHGPGESRMVEEKRHYEKPIPVSDLVLLDRERCILCDRCTRFADEVAGEPLIHFVDRGNQTQVNTFPGHPFASYFSGNTVQICPVGALTASSYRFKARPWDLSQTESTCQGCSMGCGTVVDTSRNRVLRRNGVDIDPVNWGWLCDKGRFSYEATESDDRLVSPLMRDGDELVEASWNASIRKTAALLRAARANGGASNIAMLGGARLTNEDAYAWAKLMKGVIGTDNVDAQLGDGLPAELVLSSKRATIDEMCAKGGTILWVGPDPREEIGVLFLRLRHAVVRDGVKLIAITPGRTSLDDLAAVTLHPRPGETGRLVESLLSGGPAPVGLDGDFVGAQSALSGDFTLAVGRTSLAESAGYAVDAAAAVARHRPGTPTMPLLRRGNINGALDMGLAPGLLPGRVDLEAGFDTFSVAWAHVPTAKGLDATGILQAAAAGKIDTLVLVGADPLADFPDRALAAAAVAGVDHLVAVDLFLTGSSAKAEVVLPAAGPDEVHGSFTNLEGRVTALRQSVTPPGTARQSWMIAAEIGSRLGADLGLESVEDIWDEIEVVSAAHAGLYREMIAATAVGVVVPLAVPDDERETEAVDETVTNEGASEPTEPGGDEAIGQSEAEVTDESVVADQPSAPIAYEFPASTPPPPVDSYALRLVVTRTLYDDSTTTSYTPALADLAAPAPLRVHPGVLDRLGVTSGSNVRASSPKAAVTVTVVADSAVAEGVAELVWRRNGPAADLVDMAETITEIRVETAS